MESAYWHRRKRASLAMARAAVGSEARLIHYELAGRYSLKAIQAEVPKLDVVDTPPVKAYGIQLAQSVPLVKASERAQQGDQNT